MILSFTFIFHLLCRVEIVSAKYKISSPSLALCPPADVPEYAFIGRSNVGKSSLINMITGKARLAKTSGTPGKTQLINHFEIKSQHVKDGPVTAWYLVDLPGFGFARRSKNTRDKWQKMSAEYIQKRENLMQVFLLIDSRHLPQLIDLEFAESLYEWTIPYSVVFTKSDKKNQKEVAKNVKLFTQELEKFQQFLPRMIITSAVKKRGRNNLLNLIQELNKDWEEG